MVQVAEPRGVREAPPFADYLRVLLRRKFLILICVVVAVAGAIGIDLVRQKQYTSTAQLQFLAQGAAGSSGTGANAILDPQAIATDLQVLQSSQVKAQAAKILKVAPPAVSLSQIGTSAVAAVSVSSSSSASAAKAANAYAQAYISYSTQQFISQQTQTEATIQRQITSIQNQINGLNGQIAGAKSGSNISGLQSQLDSAFASLNSLQQQLTQLQISTQNSAGARIIQPATPSSSPSSPRQVQDGFIAGGIGLLIGMLLAFFLERLDDRIRSKQDLEQVSEGLPSLGLIPVVQGWKNARVPLLVALDRPTSPAAEAYRGLRTSIQFVGLDRPVRKLQVTSPAVADGKTTTSANLAATLAQAGQRVVIVSCDLRRPRIHEFFGLSNDVGLTSVLVGDVNLVDALVAVPGFNQLTLLPAGPIPPNPSELLGSRRARELFEVLAEESDIVVFDSPPVLPVTDATVIAAGMDAVLLVAMSSVTTVRDFRQSIEVLGRVDAPLFGTILNGASEADSYMYYRYGYQYGYGYGSDGNEKQRYSSDLTSAARGRNGKSRPPAVDPTFTRGTTTPRPSPTSEPQS